METEEIAYDQAQSNYRLEAPQQSSEEEIMREKLGYLGLKSCVAGLAGLAFGSKANRTGGSEGWWSGWAGITLALAVCGGLVTVARRFRPAGVTGSVDVVGRVSLSPRHSVYLLRVGRRVLLVGTGPQGPPALISELDELPADPQQGEPP